MRNFKLTTSQNFISPVPTLQIEKRFLRKLSSHLGVTPIKQAPQLSPTAHKPTTIAPGLHEQATDAPIDLSTQAESPPVARETSQPVRRAAPREDSEGELLYGSYSNKFIVT